MGDTTDQGGQGQEPGTQGGPQGQEPAGKGQGPTFDLSKIADEDARAYVARQLADLAEARREAASYRTTARDLQTKVDEHERSKMTEVEKAKADAQAAQDRAAALEKALAERNVGDEVEKAALAADALNPRAVLAMIKEKVQVGKDGKPTNLAELIKDLKASDPYMFKRTTADAGAGSGQANGANADMNTAIRAAAGRLSIS